MEELGCGTWSGQEIPWKMTLFKRDFRSQGPEGRLAAISLKHVFMRCPDNSPRTLCMTTQGERNCGPSVVRRVGGEGGLLAKSVKCSTED